jgi:hypothetical protein
MAPDTTFKIQNTLLVIFIIALWVFYYGENYNYWGITDKNKNSLIIIVEYKLNDLGIINISGEEILEDVGWGRIDMKNVKLTSEQTLEVFRAIIKNPDNYNSAQKFILPDKLKSGKQILEEIAIDYKTPNLYHLTKHQIDDISSLILKEPKKYSESQKRFLPDYLKPGAQILFEVGMGYRKVSSFKLSLIQQKQIDSLILNNPDNYSSPDQKLFLNQTKQ